MITEKNRSSTPIWSYPQNMPLPSDTTCRKTAPRVFLAKGQGQIAEKIIQIALDNNIEIRRDEDLLQILKAVDINEEIPVEAFAAVAEIISYIYQQNGKELNASQ